MNGFREPTRAELREIQARRERSDKISQIMGQYLLKGYRMLDSYCPNCSNILMRTRQGEDYCVACEEVNNDRRPPSPNFDPTDRPEPSDEPDILPSQVVAEIPLNQDDPGGDQGEELSSKKPRFAPNNLDHRSGDTRTSILFTISAVEEKMRWAASKLRSTDSADLSRKYLELIRECAHTLTMLKEN